VALNWIVAGVSIIPNGLKHDGSILRLSPNSKGSQHNEQAGSFLRVGVRQLPYDWRTQITHPQIRLSALRGRASSALRLDRRDRPDNMRIHVDFKHYWVHRRSRNALLMISSKKWENAGRVGRL
jgi:hypothetical protein